MPDSPNLKPPNPICAAIDTPDLQRARALAAELRDDVGYIKIGMEFFYAHGPKGYEWLAGAGLPVFLDLKLHDIPNTVASALKALMRLQPRPAIVNVHAAGGLEMMRAAREAVPQETKLIAVTVLTSLTTANLNAVGFDAGRDAVGHSQSLAALAASAGLDGVVCSSHDLAFIREAQKLPFLTVVPGIRPAGADTQDQRRVATPAEAMALGADILVIGRPITGAADPAAAARAILASLAEPEVQVKICGLSTCESLEAALDAGADMVGFVFYGPSPRNVSLERAAALADIARGRTRIVALTVDADDEQILAIREMVRPDLYQLHGGETPARAERVRGLTGKPVIKAVKVKHAGDVADAAAFARSAEIVLFDAKSPETLTGALPGGNGVAFDWSLLGGGAPKGFMLSGGLNPENVAGAIAATGARLVDVSSGVETAPGVKDSETHPEIH